MFPRHASLFSRLQDDQDCMYPGVWTSRPVGNGNLRFNLSADTYRLTKASQKWSLIFPIPTNTDVKIDALGKVQFVDGKFELSEPGLRLNFAPTSHFSSSLILSTKNFAYEHVHRIGHKTMLDVLTNFNFTHETLTLKQLAVRVIHQFYGPSFLNSAVKLDLTVPNITSYDSILKHANISADWIAENPKTGTIFGAGISFPLNEQQHQNVLGRSLSPNPSVLGATVPTKFDPKVKLGVKHTVESPYGAVVLNASIESQTRDIINSHNIRLATSWDIDLFGVPLKVCPYVDFKAAREPRPKWNVEAVVRL